ncbi:GNAT family N-acetyltransferase [Sphingobacteriales bacterium UPWRP_1]|nr:hypothetical protein BVG80_10800 [Sphingobacteriales bacterium TSM_CSM]PSJ77408.1 GNAT family N-acetyltransferase [Sphingobacteriales bacterium UPWRP_1]
MRTSVCFGAAVPAPDITATVTATIIHTVYSSVSDIDAEEWDSVFGKSENLPLQHAYLLALEQSNEGKIDFRYVLFRRNSRAVGVACFQLFEVSGSEALKTSAIEQQQAEPAKGVRESAMQWVKKISFNRINRLNLRMLICGNALMTGEYGFYFTPQIPDADAVELVRQVIDQTERQEAAAGKKIDLVLVKDFKQQRNLVAETLLKRGYRKISFQPNMVMHLQPEWLTFEHYLSDMSSKYRVRAKRVLKKGAEMERKDFDATAIEQQLPAIYSFYTEVADSMDFNLLSASPRYFAELKKQLGHRFRLIAYCLNGQMVGFITAIAGKQHMEVHFTGYNHPLNRDYAIYSNILYDMVKLGIEHRVQTISFGRTALEIKSTVGATGEDMPAFIKHRSRLVNRLLIPLINQFNQEAWIPRHPFKQAGTEGETD